jgi:hypothetical protein
MKADSPPPRAGRYRVGLLQFHKEAVGIAHHNLA